MTKIKNYKIYFFIFLIIFTTKVTGNENKVLFKLGDQSYTSFDLEIRKKYLNFVGENQNIDNETLKKDYISVIIFNEYFNNTKIKNIKNLNDKVIEVFENIRRQNSNLKNLDELGIEKELIFKNLKYDLIRKSILENLINTQKDQLFNNYNDSDLLYDYFIEYINIDLRNENINKNEIDNSNILDLNNLKEYLKKRNINYFYKKNKVSRIDNVNIFIKEKINNNINFFSRSDKNSITFFNVKKSFSTSQGLVFNLLSFKNKNLIDSSELNCNNMKKFKKNNIVTKEYEYSKLNNKIKDELLDIDDYIYIKQDDGYTFIILCGIKFDKEIFNNNNLNQQLSSALIKIETKFLNKYKKLYNLTYINE